MPVGMNMYRLGVIRVWVLGLIAAIGLLFFPAAPAGAVGFPLSQSDSRIQAALDFLRNSEAARSQLWTNPEKACYAIVAVESCGGDAHAFTNAEGKSLVDIIRENAPNQLKPQASASLIHAAYLFAIVAAGENPHSFAGIDVVQQLKNMFDGTQIGMPAIINDDFWAVITLVGAGESPTSEIIQTAKNHILANQSPDGGWGCNTGGSGSDPCNTANAIIALRAAGESPSSPAIQKGLAYLKSMQKDDGGFPYYADYPSDTGSDARVIAALTACGIDPTSAEWSINGRNAVSHALSLQQPDGGFAWHSGGSTDPWMTTYILPALVGKHWPPDLFSGRTVPAPTPSPPANTPQPTPASLPGDTEPPVIGTVFPTPGETVNEAKPTIRATYTDPLSGIAIRSVVLKVDGADVTGSAAVTSGEIVYTPASPLKNGSHSVELSLRDGAGNRARKSWNFQVFDPSMPSPEPPRSGAAGAAAIKPIIIVLTPAPGETVSTPFPTLTAAYSAPGSAIDPRTVVLKVDSMDVTSQAAVAETHITYTPRMGLAPGTHTVELVVFDTTGNRTRRSWNFNVESGPPSSADLSGELDISGTVAKSLSLAFCEGMVRIEIGEGSRVLDGSGEPLRWVNARRAAAELTPPVDLCPIGPVYLLEPEGARLDPPARLTMGYLERAAGERPAWDADGNGTVDTLDLIRMNTPEWEGVWEEGLTIASYDRERDEWVILDGSSVAMAANAVTAPIAMLGPVVIVGNGRGAPSFPAPISLAAGVRRSADGRAELSIEEGTILSGFSRAEPEIGLWDDPPPSPAGLCRIGPAYRIGPDDARLDPPAVLNLVYDEMSLSEGFRWDTNGDGLLDLGDDVRGTAPEDFRIARCDPASGQWELLPSTVDRQSRTVTARIERSGGYALMGPEARPIRVRRIEIVPSEAELGAPVTFRLTVENPGSGKGTYLLRLSIDGVPEHERELTLPPGAHEIEIVHREPYAGDYTVSAGGATAVFSVRQPARGSSAFPMVIGGAVGGGAAIAGLALFGWRMRRTKRGGRP